MHNEGCNIGFFDTTIRYNSSRIKEELRLTKDVIEVLDVFLRSLSSDNKGEWKMIWLEKWSTNPELGEKME